MNPVKTLIMGLTLVCLIFFLPQVSLAGQVDNSIYKELLTKHVHGSRVSYDGFKQDESRLDEYLALLSDVDPDTLALNHQFAFYINVYNAFTIKLILMHYPGINSIKEIGSFFSNPWSKKFIPLNGRTVTLDFIEHEVLRPRFKDPRIHVAINCAAKSCPPLFNQPFEGETIESQLNRQAQSFINDKRSTFIKDNTLYISKIFSWFEDDFNDNPLPFIKRYATGDLKNQLEAAGLNLKIEYLRYDWALNRR